MKKLWGTNLQSTFSAVSAGAAQIKQSWGTGEGQQQHPQQPPESAVSTAAGEKQYLRLPLESARKLRWFDKGDLQALVKTHLRDKRDLMDTITALKKLLIRSGMTDAQLDAEAQQLLGCVELMQEADDGVNSVLLVSAEAEMGALQDKIDRLEQELVAARSKSALAPQFSIGGEDAADGCAGGAPPHLDPETATSLTHAVEQLERCTAASAALGRQLRSQEQRIADHEAEQSMRLLLLTAQPLGHVGSDSADARGSDSGHGLAAAGADIAVSDGQPDGSSVVRVQMLHQELLAEREQRLVLVGKLQRLEAERRATMEELNELSDQLRELKGTADEVSTLRGALATAEARRAATEGAYEEAAAQLDVLRVQLRGAEELAERRQVELRKQQAAGQGAEALRKYQDICLEAEERAAHSERRAVLADARVAKLELALREAQQESRTAVKAAASAQRELEQMQAKVAAAEAAAASVARSTAEAQLADAASARSLGAARAVEEDLKAAQREAAQLRALLTAAELRLQAADAREARLMADLHEMEAAGAEREELAAQVLTLRGRLVESHTEKGQVEHYKQVAAQLEAARARVEEELVVTAHLATQLEAKLRESHARVDLAETDAAIAESRARVAEASITAEVDKRLVAACANRMHWPLPIKQEVERLESRHEALQVALQTAKLQLESESRLYSAESKQKAELQHRCQELDERLRCLEQESAAQLREAGLALDFAQHEADTCRRAISKLEQPSGQANPVNGTRVRASTSHGNRLCLTSSPASADAFKRERDALLRGGNPPYSPAMGGQLSGMASMRSSGTLGSFTDISALHRIGSIEQAKWQGIRSDFKQSLHVMHLDWCAISHPAEHVSFCGASEVESNPSLAPAMAPFHPAQVQNRVGGGGLYGITDSEVQLAPRLSRVSYTNGTSFTAGHAANGGSSQALGAAAAVATQEFRPAATGATAGPPGAATSTSAVGGERNKIQSPDMLYLKNVLLKFLEAHAANRLQERDALLPAVAALLQASPQEFKALKKVLCNTAPPGMQVLSALGWK